jgi:hypothetical protein
VVPLQEHQLPLLPGKLGLELQQHAFASLELLPLQVLVPQQILLPFRYLLLTCFF